MSEAAPIAKPHFRESVAGFNYNESQKSAIIEGQRRAERAWLLEHPEWVAWARRNGVGTNYQHPDIMGQSPTMRLGDPGARYLTERQLFCVWSQQDSLRAILKERGHDITPELFEECLAIISAAYSTAPP